MGLFSKFFSPSSQQPIETIETYNDFWTWFRSREREFHSVVRDRGDFERDFFDHVSPRINQLHEGLYLLSGMVDEHTAELIITPDGDIKKIVFAEELIAAAPSINGWKFTALKPASGEGFSLAIGDLVIEADKLFFVPRDHNERPDEIDIVIVHEKVSEENRDEMSHAIDLFLDNYLGELNFVTQIDNLETAGINEIAEELRPLSELKGYLQDRQVAFREKYDTERTQNSEDVFSLLTAESKDGLPLMAAVNSTLLLWDKKVSHPWVAYLDFGYPADDNGLPSSETLEELAAIEEELTSKLVNTDGYLYVGRQTFDGVRTVYFACKDFRLPSKVFSAFGRKYANEYEIDFAIYKDKYWQSFDRLSPVQNNELVD
jgi:hypothetical protein